MWGAIPGIIDKTLGLINTLLNPEDTRKRKLRKLFQEEATLRRKIEKKMAEGKKSPNKRDAVALGVLIDELISVQRRINRNSR